MKSDPSKKIIIIGATSGIGKALAELYVQKGNYVGITGRRFNLLQSLRQQYPEQILTECFDVRGDQNIHHLNSLIEQLGGLDLLIYNAGYGEVSKTLNWEIEKATYETNVRGFIEIINYSFNYFVQQGNGHIAATSSIAAIRGNSWAPAYSASKSFMSNYMEGLYMKAKRMRLPIYVTDIQPGFVKTKLAKGNPQFWIAQTDKAVMQIAKAIEKKKWRVYITKRWWLIAQVMKLAPGWLYHKFG